MRTLSSPTGGPGDLSMRPRTHAARVRPSVRVVSAGLLALLLGSVSCGERSLMMAVGSTGELGLVTAFETADRRVASLDSLLEAPVAFVRNEKRFTAHVVEPSLLRGNRTWKCLAFLVDVNNPGPLARPLRNLLSDADRADLGREPHGWRVVQAVWARGQTVLVVHSADPAGFPAWLHEHGREILEAYEAGIISSLRDAVLAIGERTDMGDYLERNYGFTLRIPKDYQTGEDAEGRVVRCSRVIQDEIPRFVFVHWMPASAAPDTEMELLALRDSLGLAYYDGDRVELDRSFARPGTFQGRPAILLEGIYQNEKHLYGGPFRSFAFTRGERFYFIDVSVYNPPGDKLPYLREVLAIAHTFRTTADD